LLSPDKQLSLLDSFARAQEQLGEYQKQYGNCRRCSPTTRHSTVWKRRANRNSICFDIRSTKLPTANLNAGEEEESRAAYKLASNSKRLIELASAVANKLAEADDSVLSQLAETQRLLRELEKIDNSIAQFSSAHAAGVVELYRNRAFTFQLRRETRPRSGPAFRTGAARSLFETLKRKYGGSSQK